MIVQQSLDLSCHPDFSFLSPWLLEPSSPLGIDRCFESIVSDRLWPVTSPPSAHLATSFANCSFLHFHLLLLVFERHLFSRFDLGMPRGLFGSFNFLPFQILAWLFQVRMMVVVESGQRLFPFLEKSVGVSRAGPASALRP